MVVLVGPSEHRHAAATALGLAGYVVVGVTHPDPPPATDVLAVVVLGAPAIELAAFASPDAVPVIHLPAVVDVASLTRVLERLGRNAPPPSAFG